MALQYGLDLPQVIGLKRRARGHQIADQIRATQARGDLDRARQRHDLGADLTLLEIPLEQKADRWWRFADHSGSRFPGRGGSPGRPVTSGSARTRVL